MGYTLGMPSLKLSNTAGKGGKHCGNFKKVTEEALGERLGQDLDINHDLTHSNEYLTDIKTATQLQQLSQDWIENYNRRIDEENIQIEEDIKKAVKEFNEGREEKLTKVKALKAINDERRANKQEPLQTKRHIRDDAVVMCATIIKPSAEFMSTLNKEDQRQLLLDTYDKLKEIVGGQNMKAAVIHYDELVPHLHTFWMPETEDGRLCAKEMHGLKFLGTLNREMPAYLRSKGWDIDDCNAYDAEEEQRKKEEMGEKAYKKAKQEKRQNQGRSSSKFKYEVQKEVAKLEEQETELIDSISEKKDKEAVITNSIKEIEKELEAKKEELDQQILAIDLGKSYPQKVDAPAFSRPEEDKNTWINNNLNPDLKLFEKIKEQKQLGEAWEERTNAYKLYDTQIAEWKVKEKEWRKDYSNLSAIQESRNRWEEKLNEADTTLNKAKNEALLIIERSKEDAAARNAAVSKKESDVEIKEKKLNTCISEFEKERMTMTQNYNKYAIHLKKLKAKIEAEVLRRTSLLLQSQRHSTENLNFIERIRMELINKNAERQSKVKERIKEIEEYTRSR